MSRSTSAATVSTALVRPSDTPTATLLPAVWPVAVVVALPLWSAVLLNLPESVASTGDSPSRAVVIVFTATVTAASGVTATLAPAAPPVTSVVSVWSAVALRPKSLPLVISELSPASATVVA